MEWNKSSKISSSVLASGMIGAVAAPGVVFCAERCLPQQMAWLKREVANHIVMPHLATFEKLSTRLHNANERRCEKSPEACTPDPALAGVDSSSPYGRAMAISDGLVTSLLSWGVDFGATYGSQKLLNKKLGINTSPLKTAVIDSTVSLGAMGVLCTIGAKPAEAINHTLSTIIQKTTGMSKDHAEDFTHPLVFAGIPNIVGTLAALQNAHHFNKGR